MLEESVQRGCEYIQLWHPCDEMDISNLYSIK
jgi:hypothetical protein